MKLDIEKTIKVISSSSTKPVEASDSIETVTTKEMDDAEDKYHVDKGHLKINNNNNSMTTTRVITLSPKFPSSNYS